MTAAAGKIDREAANKEALKRLTEADPVLVDVRPAIEVVPGMKPDTILTSGAPVPWSDIKSIQRTSIINGLVYEGLAADADEATAKLDNGEIVPQHTQAHGCVGISTGVYTASMPVYVVENRTAGNRAFCHILEGNPPRLFVNGCWGDDVIERLRFVQEVYAPIMGEAVRLAGGIPLKPIMRRALTMGDELHTRCDAATQLFISTMFPHLLEVAREHHDEVRRAVHLLQTTPFSFLRVAVAGTKSALDAAHGIEGCSLVTAIVHGTKEFAIRVGGLGDEWFRGPHPEFQGKFFYGSTAEDILWSGGESTMMETFGLGGMAQAASFSLPFAGSVQDVMDRNLAMYPITAGQCAEFKIPSLGKGIPFGIDIFKVVETGVTPFLNAALSRKDGEGLAGLGPAALSMKLFEGAVAAYEERYG